MIKKVIKFSAGWCMPCRLYKKTFEEVKNSDEFKDIIFEEIDVDEYEEIAYKYGVRGVPTTIMLDEKDDVLLRLTGNISRSTLEGALKGNVNG